LSSGLGKIKRVNTEEERGKLRLRKKVETWKKFEKLGRVGRTRP